jgi:hypothetical protein
VETLLGKELTYPVTRACLSTKSAKAIVTFFLPPSLRYTVLLPFNTLNSAYDQITTDLPEGLLESQYTMGIMPLAQPPPICFIGK